MKTLMQNLLAVWRLTVATLVIGLLAFAAPAHAGSITWSGRVDDNVDIIVQGNSVSYQNITDAGLADTTFNFNGGVYPFFRNLRLENVSGRGSVSISHRSRPAGEATVHISDPQLGAGFYKFTLVWDDDEQYGANGGPGYSGMGAGYPNNSLHWHGRVEGTEAVHLQGSNVTWNRVQGSGAWGMTFHINGSLPQGNVKVRVVQNQGRGRVYILGQPTANNGYRLTVRVEDFQDGSDEYDFTASW